MIITTTSVDDLKLILSALSAYQHNMQYRTLYERLRRQVERLEKPRVPSLLAARGA